MSSPNIAYQFNGEVVVVEPPQTHQLVETGCSDELTVAEETATVDVRRVREQQTR